MSRHNIESEAVGFHRGFVDSIRDCIRAQRERVRIELRDIRHRRDRIEWQRGLARSEWKGA